MSGPVEVREVATPHGPGRLTLHRAPSRTVTLLLSHGAGTGTGTHDLRALADGLPAHGVEVVLLDQPWVLAGRRLATPPPTLDDALLAAVDELAVEGSLVLGGRSAGARSAARCAGAAGAAACLALAFPLHPPRRPERSRLPELLGAGVPTLVVAGERDALGRPEEYPDDLADHGVELAVVDSADHSFAVPRRSGRTEEEVDAGLVEVVAGWLGRRGLRGTG